MSEKLADLIKETGDNLEDAETNDIQDARNISNIDPNVEEKIIEKKEKNQSKIKELIQEIDEKEIRPDEGESEITIVDKSDLKLADAFEVSSAEKIADDADLAVRKSTESEITEPVEPLNRNNTNFPLQLKEALAGILTEIKKGKYLSDIDAFLKYYQLLTKHYFTWMIKAKIKSDNFAVKGMLIAQVMGSGKTALSVACALANLNLGAEKVVVMLLKSLQENFIGNIKMVLGKAGILDKDADNFIKTKFKFVAFNASNMIKQLWKSSGEVEDALIDLDMGELLLTSNTLENTLVIIDEFHLLLRAITNGSKNGIAFYNVMMKTPSAKILGLTGSIIANHPFEVAVCYNLMTGRELFPENYLEFHRLFCDTKGRLRPEVRSKFQNRIMGLTSYIGLDDLRPIVDENSPESKQQENFTPELRDEIIVKVEMSDYQTGLYLQARAKEAEELSYASSQNIPNLQKPRTEMSGTYRQKSRQLSNYAPPLDKKITPDNASSPKFEAILEKLESLPGIHILYSQYTGIGGLGAFKIFLNGHGWEPWQKQKEEEKSEESKEEKSEEESKESKEEKSENKEESKEIKEEKSEQKEESKEETKEEKSEKSEESKEESKEETKEEKLEKIADILEESKNEPFKKAFMEIKKEEKEESKEQKISDMLEEEKSEEKEEKEENPQNESKENPQNESKEKSQNKSKKIKLVEFVGKGESKYSYKYALFTGDEDPETRSAALQDFNDPKNIDGSLIKVLMISSAGALGVDTVNCRYVHIMEPYWTENHITQIKYRARRLNSARDLPADQRFVQPYFYTAYPGPVKTNAFEGMDPEFVKQSTDEEIFIHAKDGYEVNKTWIEPIRETSIECPILAELWKDDRICKMCAPSGQPLFTENIIKDLRSADNCMPYSKKEVEAKSIILEYNGKEIEVFYDIGPTGVNGFVMDLGLGGYRPIKRSEKLYEILADKLGGTQADAENPTKKANETQVEAENPTEKANEKIKNK